MTSLLRIVLAAACVLVLACCKQRTATGDFLQEMFDRCVQTTQAPAESKTFFCHCVAKDIVSTHSVDELDRMSKRPANFMDMEKTRSSVTSCGELVSGNPTLRPSTKDFASLKDGGKNHRHWREVRSGHQTHFVYMPEAYWKDLDEYRQAVSDLCKPKEACSVSFWKDISMIPTRYPLSREQALSQIPIIANYMTDGTIRVEWGCENLTPKPVPCPPDK